MVAEDIWTLLENVPDPEIPVVSVVDLGIVRGVEWDRDQLVVTITPTYSGCPATEVIARDIRAALESHGLKNFVLKTQLSPAWTTDWLSDKGREKLREFGIAPPAKLVQIDEPVRCPRCGSISTEQVSRFGSTPCKALYKCRECLEPFDAFKRH